LATFGETGWFGGLTTFSGPQGGQENRAVTGGKFLHFPCRDAHALDFTKSGQEPESGAKMAMFSRQALYVIRQLHL
jgi:hypothetical protein